MGHRVTASGVKSYILGNGTTYRTNSIASSFAVNFDLADHTFLVGATADSYFNGSGSFGFGTTTPEASAAVEVNSTTKGFLPPVMTTVEKNAISSPAAGLMVFDTDLGKLCIYTGAAWETITSV
jgi:hypothetical protein